MLYRPIGKQQTNSFSNLFRNIKQISLQPKRALLCLIHRVIEYVINEGPAFEAMLMTREIANPLFRFLFDQQSPAHSYYRWRLCSLLNGDNAFKWKTKPFKMFKNGSYWLPPPVNKYTQSVSDEAFDKAFSEFEIKKGAFSKEYVLFFDFSLLESILKLYFALEKEKGQNGRDFQKFEYRTQGDIRRDDILYRQRREVH